MAGQSGTREWSVPQQLYARSSPQAIQHWIARARHLGFESVGQFDADAGAGRIGDPVRRLAGIGFQVEEFGRLRQVDCQFVGFRAQDLELYVAGLVGEIFAKNLVGPVGR